MRASFPTEFDAVLLGKSRDAGEFKTGDGDSIRYGDAYDLSFESSDGLVQTCRVSITALDEAADFEVVSAPRLTPLRVVGDVQVNDKGGYFKPTQVRRANASSAKS